MNIKCTQCGAGVPLEQDKSFARCPFCETALYIDTSRTVKRFYLEAQAGERDLGPQLQRKLMSREIKDPVKVGPFRKYYFPFWRLDTRLGASVLVPAAEAPLEDLAGVRLPAGGLRFFSEDLGGKEEVVEPEVLLEDAEAHGRRLLGLEDTVEFSGAVMVHVPLIEVEYDCRGGRFRAVVEAVSGEVYADDWPAAPARKKDLVLGWIAALAFVLFVLEAALVPKLWMVVPAYALTAAGIYFLARTTLHRMGW